MHRLEAPDDSCFMIFPMRQDRTVCEWAVSGAAIVVQQGGGGTTHMKSAMKQILLHGHVPFPRSQGKLWPISRAMISQLACRSLRLAWGGEYSHTSTPTLPWIPNSLPASPSCMWNQKIGVHVSELGWTWQRSPHLSCGGPTARAPLAQEKRGQREWSAYWCLCHRMTPLASFSLI